MKFNNEKLEEQHYLIQKLFTKITILSIIQFALTIPWIILLVFFVKSFIKYGWGIQQANMMPYNQNAMRAWFLFVSFLYLLASSFSLYYGIQGFIKDKKWYFLTSFLNSFIFPFFLYSSIKNHYLHYYFKYINATRFEQLQIDHYAFLKWIKKETKSTPLIRNTLLFYITLAISFVAFAFCLVPQVDKKSPETNYIIFSIFSFFTQQNNMMCFLFLFLFCFLNKRNVFKENTFMNYMCSYILIVGFVAMVMALPYIYLPKTGSSHATIFTFVKFLWLHVFHPVFFAWFTFSSMAKSNAITGESFLKFFIRGIIYPLCYGVYLYSMPFVVRYSIYGQLTNLNKWMVDSNGKPLGDPFWLIGIAAMFLLFFFVLFLIKFLNKILIRNKQSLLIYISSEK